MDLEIRGLTALVTGGSRGIGLAIADRLAAEGCNLHLAARTMTALDAAREKLVSDHGVRVVCHALDVSAPGAHIELASNCGELDILVNNAGALPHGELADIDEIQWRSAWELKVYGYINLSRTVYTSMCERRRGVIVNVIGTAGERPTSGYVVGASGNAALMGFTRALGGGSTNHGVRVVGVNPGPTETERQTVRWEARSQQQLGDPQRWRELVTNAPFGRLGRASEVANVVAFLASGCASYVSGTIITVDGGRGSRNSV
jgi:3-oxoacyl-[acyl-carrier protein] reductase